MPDQYDLWRQERKEPLPLERRADRSTDPKLMGGFWRIEGARTKHDTPVAIWTAEGADASVFQIGRKVMNTAEHVDEWQNFVTSTWLSCRATTKAEWAAALETGFWPGDNKASRAMTKEERAEVSLGSVGGNDAPAEEVLADEIASLAERINAATATNLDEGNALAGLLDRMRVLLDKAEETRKAEKKPHWDAGKAVDAKFAVIVTPGEEAYADGVKRRQKFLDAEQARLNKLAAEENARLAKEAAKKGTEPPPKVEPKRATVGSDFGRQVGLKKVKVAVIEDLPMLVNALLFTGNGPDADALAYFQGRADKALRGGITLPGVRVEDDLR